MMKRTMRGLLLLMAATCVFMAAIGLGVAPTSIGAMAQESRLPPCDEGVFSRPVWDNCHGTRVYSTGEKYVGEFKADKESGRGRTAFSSGQVYVGEYKFGKRNGQGVFTWPDGQKYVGELKNDKMDGRGTLTFPGGDDYVGEFKDGEKNGHGAMTWPSGQKYVGEFKSNKRSGYGAYTWPNGKKQAGIWQDDRLVREGSAQTASASSAQAPAARASKSNPLVDPLKKSTVVGVKRGNNTYTLKIFAGDPDDPSENPANCIVAHADQEGVYFTNTCKHRNMEVDVCSVRTVDADVDLNSDEPVSNRTYYCTAYVYHDGLTGSTAYCRTLRPFSAPPVRFNFAFNSCVLPRSYSGKAYRCPGQCPGDPQNGVQNDKTAGDQNPPPEQTQEPDPPKTMGRPPRKRSPWRRQPSAYSARPRIFMPEGAVGRFHSPLERARGR